MYWAMIRGEDRHSEEHAVRNSDELAIAVFNVWTFGRHDAVLERLTFVGFLDCDYKHYGKLLIGFVRRARINLFAIRTIGSSLLPSIFQDIRLWLVCQEQNVPSCI